MSFEVLAPLLGALMLGGYALVVFSKFGEVERALRDSRHDAYRLVSRIVTLEKRIAELEAEATSDLE